MIFQHLDTATVLFLLSSVILPAVSSLIKRPHWSIGVAGAITVVLAAAGGFLTTWADSSNATHYDWKTAAGLALSSLVVAFLSRSRLWAGTKTDEHLQAI